MACAHEKAWRALRPAHSMSTDRMRNLESALLGPSAGWLTRRLNMTSTSSWQVDCGTGVCRHAPAGSSTQLPPVTLQSTMKRSMNSTLLSNVGTTTGVGHTPGMARPFSSTPRADVTMVGSAIVIFRNGRLCSRCERGEARQPGPWPGRAAGRWATPVPRLVLPQRLLAHNLHPRHVHGLLLPPTGGLGDAVLGARVRRGSCEGQARSGVVRRGRAAGTHVERPAEGVHVVRREPGRHGCVKVRLKAVHVAAHRVAWRRVRSQRGREHSARLPLAGTHPRWRRRTYG